MFKRTEFGKRKPAECQHYIADYDVDGAERETVGRLQAAIRRGDAAEISRERMALIRMMD